MSFIFFLEKMDKRESDNLNGRLGLPHGATPLLNRSRKRRRIESLAYVELDGRVALVSQPKKANKK